MVVVVLVLAYFGTNTALHRVRGSTACDAMLRAARQAHAIWQSAGMRYKAKALVGFYQCVAAVPIVFDVVPPLGLEEYTRWINLFELPSELENIFVPTACLGDYRTRVLVGSLWPIALVLLCAVGFVCWELLQGWKADRRAGSAVRGGLQRVLPLTLGLTFLVVPSVSTRLFRAFLCEPIEYSPGEVRRYLKADLSLSCDSADYEATSTTAFALIAVWPVGLPLLYAALLLVSRKALVSGVPTPLSQATAFLSGDCTVEAFWWEPLEMCRKLLLTGWVLLVRDDAEQARVLVAVLISFAFLALRFAVKPLKRCAAQTPLSSWDTLWMRSTCLRCVALTPLG
eukprot:2143546-Prymnesium_polylepis.2